ncbi:MAG: FAD binding domain-containing protein [Nitrospinota bacterium]
MKPLEILEPASLEEACEQLSEGSEGVKVVGGGIAISILMKQRIFQPTRLVSIRRIAGFDAVRHDAKKGLIIGAGALHRTLETSSVVQEHCPLLAEVMSQVANVRIRCMGTLGGELAHADPHSDPPPVLIGLGAKAVARSTRGEREIPFTDFFTGYLESALEPDEILKEVIIPDPPPGVRSAYLKFTPNSSTDWPCLGVTAFVGRDPDGTCRSLDLIFGSVTEVPFRVPGVSEMASGQPLGDPLIHEIAEHCFRQVDPMADSRGSSWYKKELVRAFARRILNRAVSGNGTP